MKTAFFTIFMTIALMASAQSKIYVTANGETRTVTLADNSATSRLKELLSVGNISISMSDYGSWEKVGDLPQSLPTSNSQITAQPGDIMLYQGYQMVIFYGNNSWSYTRLGKIDNTSDLKGWLGNGNVDVTLSLDIISGIENTAVDKDTPAQVFDLMGRPVNHRPLAPGTYIINGKKTFVHLAFEVPGENTSTKWLEPVSNQEYTNLK